MKVSNVGGKLLGLALLLAGALVILAYYWTAAGGDLPFSGKKYMLGAVIHEPQDLQKHADVRAAGVKVGSVSSIQPAGSSAHIEMKLDKSVAPVYRNATVLIRQKTLVGENYIALTRGDPNTGVLPSGSDLSTGADQAAIPLDRILNSLDATTRKHVSAMLRDLGGGLAGRGQELNQLFGALRPTLSDGSKVAQTLNAQRTQVANVVDQAATLFDAIDQRRTEMQSLVTSAKATATAVAERDQALRAAFAQFPGALAQARSSVAKLSSFSGTATPVIANLRAGLVDLRPVLRDLKPVADSTKVLFQKLPPLLTVANPLLSRLRSFSKVSTPTFPALNATLRQAVPALDYLKPYSKDTVGFMQNFGLNHFYDQSGALGYCTCPINDRSFSNWTPELRKLAGVLLDQGILSKIVHTDNNPVRPPDQLPRATTPFSGTYPRIQAKAPGG
jgi:phospholipid/cholesterol/gamma-HCH transport system substrate-binding protein